MVGLFAILALLLALTGIYGVMSYAASSRAREIAIRLALGANPVDTMLLLLSHGARLTMAGLVVGGVAAAGLTRVLVGILYQLSPTDPMTFTAVAAMLGVVAMAAYFVPAMKVLGIDAMEVQRHDWPVVHTNGKGSLPIELYANRSVGQPDTQSTRDALPFGG